MRHPPVFSTLLFATAIAMISGLIPARSFIVGGETADIRDFPYQVGCPSERPWTGGWAGHDAEAL
jgi:hypothetical protein